MYTQLYYVVCKLTVFQILNEHVIKWLSIKAVILDNEWYSHFTGCTSHHAWTVSKKKTYVHTARWIIVTGSLIVKNPCFNIFTRIFSRKSREWNISKSKRYSKAGRTIGCSRGFRRKRCDHEVAVTGKQVYLVHFDRFSWGDVHHSMWSAKG